MSKRWLSATLSTLALVMTLAAPSAFASGGGVSSGGVNSGGGTGGSGGGGGNPTETSSSQSTTGPCIKVSASAVAAFSYYTSLTLSDSIQNCSTQTLTLETVFSAGPGASAGCASQLGAGATYFVTVAPGARAAQQASFFAFSPTGACAPGDPIVATVMQRNEQPLATATATWTTGVTP
jgi:hypothetical protein